MTNASRTSAVAFAVPGLNDVAVNLYGPMDTDPLDRGYYVSKSGKPVPISDILEEEADAVNAWLAERYPNLAIRFPTRSERRAQIVQ
jgi:hypothetical protein